MQLENHSTVSMRTMRKVLPDFSVPLDQVRALQQLLSTGLAPSPGLDSERLRFADLYLDIFRVFEHRMGDHPDLQLLRRTVALQAARIAFRPPWSAGTWRIARRIGMLDAGFPARFLFHLVSASGRYAHEQAGMIGTTRAFS
jgi:hypothetical protein